MVTVQDTELKKGIEQAIAKARELSMPILVSEVQKVDHIEPLAFFSAGQKKYLGERFYWKDPSDDIFISGLGICKLIHCDQNSDRFFHVEKEWKKAIENGIIYNDFHEAGTGPLMFGGFSFDPIKKKTQLWSKFSDALFHMPKYLLTKVNGQYYLTTNVLCTQHDDLSIAERVFLERQQILSSVHQPKKVKDAAINKKEEVNPENWKETVRKLVSHLKNGELKKAVLARELRLYFNDDVPIEGVLKRLLTEQRESYTFAFESNGDCFIGASPERLVKKEGKKLYSTCLAGSIARGKTEEEDEQLGQTLLGDDKNLMEHQFVVEMIKDAMEQVCEQVELPDHPVLMKMRDIQHLFTPVVGISKSQSSLFQLVDRLHPTPALGGFPKQDAVEMIREIEELDRGLYGAPVGWIDNNGNGEFAVAIRSALIQGNEASLFAGCGIISDSDAESEYSETKVKFKPMLSALGGMEK